MLLIVVQALGLATSVVGLSWLTSSWPSSAKAPSSEEQPGPPLNQAVTGSAAALGAVEAWKM